MKMTTLYQPNPSLLIRRRQRQKQQEEEQQQQQQQLQKSYRQHRITQTPATIVVVGMLLLLLASIVVVSSFNLPVTRITPPVSLTIQNQQQLLHRRCSHLCVTENSKKNSRRCLVLQLYRKAYQGQWRSPGACLHHMQQQRKEQRQQIWTLDAAAGDDDDNEDEDDNSNDNNKGDDDTNNKNKNPTTDTEIVFLDESNMDSSALLQISIINTNKMVKQISKMIHRTSWISWWCQMILTVVSSVILVFAKSIASRGSNNNFVLSSLGIIVSFLSILYTWGNGTRLSYRILQFVYSITFNGASNNDITISTALSSSVSSSEIENTIPTIKTILQRAIMIGVIINCIGLFINLIAAQQIIGLFAIKVFTSRVGGGNIYDASLLASTSNNILQPIDVLIIQANTNILLSQYISCIALLSFIPRIIMNFSTNKTPTTTTSSPPTSSSSKKEKKRNKKQFIFF